MTQRKYTKLVVFAGHTTMTKTSPALALLELQLWEETC